MSFIGSTLYKKTSERYPNKNTKEFVNKKSIVDLKIHQLLSSGAEHVFVSTDDDTVKNSENITYINRPQEFCNNEVNFSFVLKHIFNSLPIEDDQVVIHTSPCVPLFSRYDELHSSFKRSNINQVVAHPSTHYYLNNNKLPINFIPGTWHSSSQNLTQVFLHPWAGTCAPIGDLRETNYVFPLNFDFFNISQFEAIDIDTKEEFEVAQLLYKSKLTL